MIRRGELVAYEGSTWRVVRQAGRTAKLLKLRRESDGAYALAAECNVRRVQPHLPGTAQDEAVTLAMEL